MKTRRPRVPSVPSVRFSQARGRDLCLSPFGNLGLRLNLFNRWVIRALASYITLALTPTDVRVT